MTGKTNAVVGTHLEELSTPASASHILDSKEVYDDEGVKITGTLPNNAGDTAAISSHMDSAALHVIPAEGYYDGTNDAATVADVADLFVGDGIIVTTRTNGYAVNVDFYGTSVNYYQFYNDGSHAWKDLADVDFKNTLTQVGAYCFEDCTSLALTSLPSTLTTLGNGSFQGCSSLAITELPSGIDTVTGTCFKGCTSLSTLTMPGATAVVGGSSGTGAFDGCTGLNNATVGSAGHAVSGIGEFAFKDCGASGTLTVYTSDGNALANAPYGWTGTVTHTAA